MVHFTPEDFAELQEVIVKLREEVTELKLSIGESCRQGAETFHDNFDFEEAQRQLPLREGRLKHLIRVRNAATIVHPEAGCSRAGIGKLVKVYDDFFHEQYEFRIGSFLVLKDTDDTVSLQSPLAKAVRGASAGEKRRCEINGKVRTITIISVT